MGIVIGLVLAASILTVMSVSTMVRADEGTEIKPTVAGKGWPLVYDSSGSPNWSVATNIYSDGFGVGIGTWTPDARFQVKGGNRLTIQGFENNIMSLTYVFPRSAPGLGDKQHYFFIGAPSSDGNGDLYIGRTELNDGTTNAEYSVRIDGTTTDWNFFKRVSIGKRDPQSALQVKGYVQLDLVRTAPPAADCDEKTERGRMKVDNVNGLLYICVDSGWIAK